MLSLVDRKKTSIRGNRTGGTPEVSLLYEAVIMLVPKCLLASCPSVYNVNVIQTYILCTLG